MPNLRLESNKQPGVCYALTPDGLELPVIDVTHAAFAEPELSDTALRERFVQMLARNPLRRLPKFLRTALYRRRMRGSLVGQIMLRSRDTFVTGTSTYLMKLPPALLGAAYATPMDRRIAQSPALAAMRLRLADMAHYLAEALEPALAGAPAQPLQFVDIAGGPAGDAWNALLLLRQRDPALLARRSIFFDVLDQDEAGPAFGRAAVAALCAEGAPLHGVSVAFRRIACDWNHPALLREILTARPADTITVASSEGGLFEYGDDAAIAATLTVLAQAGGVIAVAGTFTSDDELTRKMKEGRGAATRAHSAAAFTELAARAGWQVAKLRPIPLSSRFLLQPAQS